MIKNVFFRLAQIPFSSWWTLAALSLGVLVGVVYANRLTSEMGSDFGVYYLIAHSAEPASPLYDVHFDHKGPFFYGILKLLTLAGPVSVANASFALGALLAIAVSLVSLAGWMQVQNDRGPAAFVAAVAFSSFLVFQGSNASIAVFQSSLILLSYSLAHIASKYEKKAFLFFSGVVASAAILTRIDSVVMLFGILLMAAIKPREGAERWSSTGKQLLAFVLGLGVGLFGLLGLTTWALGFSLESFLKQTIVVNLLILPEFYGTYDFIVAPDTILRLLLFAGAVQILMFLVLSWIAKRKISFLVAALILGVHVLFLLITQSDKDYHLFILAPALMFGLLVSLDEMSLLTKSIHRISIAIALSPGLLISLGTNSLPSAASYNAEIVEAAEALEGTSFFALNQGWPFIIQGDEAHELFTPLIPAYSEDAGFLNYWSLDSPYKQYDFLWIKVATYELLVDRAAPILSLYSQMESPIENLVLLRLKG